MHRGLLLATCAFMAGCGVELNRMEVSATKPPDATEAIAAAERAATQPSQPPRVVAVPFPEMPRKDVTIIDNGPADVYIPVPLMPDEGY